MIYFDNAATTKLDERVIEKMLPYMTTFYGNPNSVHQAGRESVKGLDDARDMIASIINCKPSEIYFTSGGTEGDNWIINSFAFKNGFKGEILSSNMEHPALIESLNYVQNLGIDVKYLKTNKDGTIDLLEYENKINDKTILCTTMMVNNEIGTIYPIKEIGKICKNKGVPFFTDAVQAMGTLNIDVQDLGVDMLSCSAHKFNGPKGVGFVYIKKDIQVASFMRGGYQERGLRAGTSNVAGAIGMAEALRIRKENLEKNENHIKELRDLFIGEVLKIPNTKLNGCRENRVPGNINILFNGIDGGKIIDLLDLKGVCASRGSACSAGDTKPSRVLQEIGLSGIEASSSIRFTLSKDNTKEEVLKVIEILKDICK